MTKIKKHLKRCYTKLSFYKIYNKSNAFAKNVVLKGKIILQYEPIGEYKTTKNTITERINNIQNRPVFFDAVSMLFFANIYIIFQKLNTSSFKI